MGHNRLGRLPKTLRWNEVTRLLDILHPNPALIAAAVAKASDRRLAQLANDPGLGYTFWLLVRVMTSARSHDFIGNLSKLNITTTPEASTPQFIAQISMHVHKQLSRNPSSGDFAEIASLALRTALTGTVGHHGRSLFNSSIQDIQDAFKSYSTEAQFGVVAHRFFADFFSRVICSCVDRELANHVGSEKSFPTMGASKIFMEALDLHARQSARIVEDYAGSWYSKHNWETKGEISQEETQRFAAYALRKLRAELGQQAETK